MRALPKLLVVMGLWRRLFGWKQQLTMAVSTFVAIQFTDDAVIAIGEELAS